MVALVVVVAVVTTVVFAVDFEESVVVLVEDAGCSTNDNVPFCSFFPFVRVFVVGVLHFSSSSVLIVSVSLDFFGVDFHFIVAFVVVYFVHVVVVVLSHHQTCCGVQNLSVLPLGF